MSTGLILGFIKGSKIMRVIATECSEEQQKEDTPELERLHKKAMKNENNLMWEFFGGVLTLPNGNRYQVVDG
jgi:hypothetical protein